MPRNSTQTSGDKKQDAPDLGQEHYDRQFNDIVNNAPEYPDTEKGTDDAEKAANTPEKSVDDASQSVSDRERNADPGYRNNYTGDDKKPGLTKEKVLAVLKKRGGIMGLIAGLLITGGLVTSFLGPVTMMQNLMENFSLTNDSSSTVMERRFMKVFGFSTKDTDPICLNTTKNLKCKMGRISNSALNKLAKFGVTPVFPEGTTGTDKKTGYPSKNPVSYDIEIDGKATNVPAGQLSAYLVDNPKMAAKVLGRSGAFNLRVMSQGGKYFTEKFLNPFGIKKDGGIADGENRKMTAQERYKSAMEKLRTVIPGAEKLSSVVDTVREKVRGHLGKAQKGGIAYATAVAGCVAVKAPSFIASGVAAVQLAQTMPVAPYTVLQPASKLKTSAVEEVGVAATPEDLDTAATLLTQQTRRESDGKMTAPVDSQILLAGAGVNKNKVQVSKELTPGYSVLTNPAVQLANTADQATAPACNAIMSPAAMWSAFAVDSAITVAASATIIGGLIKVVGSLVIGAIITEVATQVAGAAAEQVVTELAQNDAITEAAGEKLGDVIGISAVAYFAAGSMARNLPTLKQSQVASFVALQKENEAFNREMEIASLSPFDTSSRYTFLGSIAYNLGDFALANGAYNSNLLTTISTLAKFPFASSFGLTTSAANFTESNCGYAEDFMLQSEDPANMPAINLAGLPCTGFTEEQANMSTDTAITLIQNEGWLDETKTLAENATITDMVTSGYIKADTPLSEYIISCGDASTGDYIFNAASCTSPSSTKDTSGVGSALGGNTSGCTEDGCAGGGEDATIEGVKDARSLTAMPVMLVDYQEYQLVNGNDVGTGTKPATAATSTIDMSAVMEDSTGVDCAPGTDFVRDDVGYNQGTAVPVKLCSLPNTYETDPRKNGAAGLVNSRASGAALAMFEGLRTSVGVDRIALNDSFRTMAEQEEARAVYGGQAAKPGFSNHQMGLAFDINMGSANNGNCNGYCYTMNVNTSYPGNKVWEWLTANAGANDFKQLPSEGWHWSATGG